MNCKSSFLVWEWCLFEEKVPGSHIVYTESLVTGVSVDRGNDVITSLSRLTCSNVIDPSHRERMFEQSHMSSATSRQLVRTWLMVHTVVPHSSKQTGHFKNVWSIHRKWTAMYVICWRRQPACSQQRTSLSYPTTGLLPWPTRHRFTPMLWPLTFKTTDNEGKQKPHWQVQVHIWLL